MIRTGVTVVWELPTGGTVGVAAESAFSDKGQSRARTSVTMRPEASNYFCMFLYLKL